MGAFAESEIDGASFARQFLAAFRAQRDAGEPIPHAVDLTFYAVDAYCADPALLGPNDIDENQLRAEVSQFLARLDEPWPPVGGIDEHNRQWARGDAPSRGAVKGESPKGKS